MIQCQQNNLTFSDLFANLDEFTSLLIPTTTDIEFFKPENYFDNNIWNVIYIFFLNEFEGLYLKSLKKQFNLQKFANIWLTHLPTFYLKQQILKNNVLKDLADPQKRGNQANNTQKSANASSSVRRGGWQWNEDPINGDLANEKNVLEDINDSFNLIDDMRKLTYTKIEFPLKEFAQRFITLFTHNQYWFKVETPND